ncbi:carbonic anhydrase [Irpex lacteus]|nr:carbonic anhydrase [Irpex lacteus]
MSQDAITEVPANIQNIQDGTLRQLVEQNIEWAQKVKKQEPTFFSEGSKVQHPKILWIGCTDSRVPETTILGGAPGQICSHRNVANQVHSHDLNLQSVLVHAITEIGVEHIIVAGHTNCGALAVCVDADSPTKSKSFPKRSLDREPHLTEPFHSTSWPPPAPLDEWLADLRHIAVKGKKALSVEELTEENVKKQVENVMKSKVVQKAWAHEGRSHLLGVHGWVYDVETGLVKDLGVSKYGPEPKHWSVPGWKGHRSMTPRDTVPHDGSLEGVLGIGLLRQPAM